MNFNEEELKTAIGSILRDIRGNWGWNYEERLEEVIELLKDLKNYLPDEPRIDSIIRIAEEELEQPTDGRIFRGGYLYGYASEEGRSQEVYDYLLNVLTYPEDNNIEVSLQYKRDKKLKDLGI
jgi:hypothetical protein